MKQRKTLDVRQKKKDKKSVMQGKEWRCRCKRKLRSCSGFSLGELLAATLILLLASQVLAQGMAFAVRSYNKSLTYSHAKQLASTLTNTIETELRYTTSITTVPTEVGEEPSFTGKEELVSYFSPIYGKTKSSFSALDEAGHPVSDSGEIAVYVTTAEKEEVWQRLISTASYSSYGLKASVAPVLYDSAKKMFSVSLRIYDKEGNSLLVNQFDVLPINQVAVNEGV